MQPIITLSSGSTTSPILVNPDGWIIIEPTLGATITLQYTLGTLQDIAAGTATYTTVNSYTRYAAVRVEEELQEIYVVLSASGGSGTYHIEGELSRSARLSIRGYIKEVINGIYVTAITNPVTGQIEVSAGTAPVPLGRNFGLRAVLYGHSYADGEASTGPAVLSAFKATGSVIWANALMGWPIKIIAEAGIGGQSTTDVFPRYEKDVKPYSPDVIFVELGHNDLKGYIWPGGASDTGGLRTQLPYVIDQFEAWIPTIPSRTLVVLLGENPPGLDPSSAGSVDKYLSARFRQLNAWFASSCSKYSNVLYIPTDEASINPLSVDGVNTVGDFMDYVHPGPIGAYKRGKLIKSYLTPILPKVKSILTNNICETFGNLRMTVSSVSQTGGLVRLLFTNQVITGILSIAVGDKITIQSPNDKSLNGVYTVATATTTYIEVAGSYSGTPTSVTLSTSTQLFDNPLVVTQTGGNNFGTGIVAYSGGATAIPSQFDLYPATGETWTVSYEAYTDDLGKQIGYWLVLTMSNVSGGAHESNLRINIGNDSIGNTLYRRAPAGQTYQFSHDLKIEAGSTGFAGVRSLIAAQYYVDGGGATSFLSAEAFLREAAYLSEVVPTEAMQLTHATPEVLMPLTTGEIIGSMTGRIYFRWIGNGTAVVRLGRFTFNRLDAPVQRQPVALQ
jgi:lysophospholipase L1-like esterase